jgi:hypothetical protein
VHLDTETLERVLHGELDSRVEPAVLRHLEDCRDCAERVADVRRGEARIFALFEELDHEPPGVVRATHGARSERLRPKPGPAWHRIAAAVALVVVAGGALYALPGSPLREWVSELRSPAPKEPPSASSLDPGSEAGEPISGLAVRPSGPYEIVFVARQDSGRLRVAIVRSSELEIRVSGAPVGLESAPDRLIVSNAGSRSSYEIRLPSAGPPVAIRLEGVTVLRKGGDRVETVAARDSTGGYLLDLSRSPH